jgi:hypothetical protein
MSVHTLSRALRIAGPDGCLVFRFFGFGSRACTCSRVVETVKVPSSISFSKRSAGILVIS